MLKLFPLIPERCIAGLQAGTPRLLHVYDGAEMYPVRVIGTAHYTELNKIIMNDYMLSIGIHLVRKTQCCI